MHNFVSGWMCLGCGLICNLMLVPKCVEILLMVLCLIWFYLTLYYTLRSFVKLCLYFCICVWFSWIEIVPFLWPVKSLTVVWCLGLFCWRLCLYHRMLLLMCYPVPWFGPFDNAVKVPVVVLSLGAVHLQLCPAYTLRMWLCMKWHGAWLYGAHRMRWDGSSFMWHQPCQRCKYTTSVDIKKERAIKSYSLM